MLHHLDRSCLMRSGFRSAYHLRVRRRTVPAPGESPLHGSGDVLAEILDRGVVCGDAADWLVRLPENSVDLFFTSPPYADARDYTQVDPDDYVDWFMPFAVEMLRACAPTGSFVLNIKNRVAKRGPLRGQRHPYTYQLVLALQAMGWRWVESYVWVKPNAVPGRFGPRPKNSFEDVYHFAKGRRPYFDLDGVRVPYKADAAEIKRRRNDTNGRRTTAAGFGRDRSRTYESGGADPGNVIVVPQAYNQHYGPAGKHTAVMPEGVADYFVRALSPPGGVVIDPFAGSGTTIVAARSHRRLAGGVEINADYATVANDRISAAEQAAA